MIRKALSGGYDSMLEYGDDKGQNVVLQPIIPTPNTDPKVNLRSTEWVHGLPEAHLLLVPGHLGKTPGFRGRFQL